MAKTLLELLAGEDMEGGESFCDDIYNNLKNHWYGAAAPASPVNGMIWHQDDGRVWIYFGGTWYEFYNEFTTVTHKWLKGADKPSAAALDISALDGNYFDVTGVAAITSITTSGRVGTVIRLHFDGVLTLTHHAVDLILLGGINITTAAGDEATFIEYAAGDWRCTHYARASGSINLGIGGQIAFPAVANPSAEVHILDDYEEGTWTPVYYGSTGVIGATAYAEQTGRYVKIGQMIYLNGVVMLTNKGGWTGDVHISGLPFNSGGGATYENYGSIELRTVTFAGNYVVAEIGRTGLDFLTLMHVTSAGGSNAIPTAGIANNSGFLFSISYKTST